MLRQLFARVWGLHGEVARRKPRINRWNRWVPRLEALGARIVPAVTATFDAGTGTLSVLGDGGDNNIIIRRDSVGHVEVRDGATMITPTIINGGAAEAGSLTLSNVRHITVDALAGDDSITIDMTNGLFEARAAGFFNKDGDQGGGEDIDFDLDGGADDDTLFIRGLNRDQDRIDLGVNGINLNGNGSVDVTHSNIEDFSVDGQRGGDKLNAGGNNTVGAAFTTSLTILGIKGDDDLTGGTGDDTVNGGKGNDKLTGGLGDDSFVGGDGIDTLVEKGDVDFTLTDTSLEGNGSDDVATVEEAKLTGGDGDNAIDASGFTKKVTINGKGGDDELTGGDKDDDIDGGDGDDTVDGGAGNDNVAGGLGDDSILGDAGADDLSGGDGDDTIDGGTEDDRIRGDADDDTLLGNDGDDDADGGAGADSIDGGADNDDVRGGQGDDTVVGGAGDDEVSGQDGADSLDGGADDDTVEGGEGADSVTGGLGDDTLRGNEGEDTLIEEGDVNFTLTDASLTGNGTDDLSGFEKATLTGGDGDNSINASAFTGPVTINGGEGDDTIQGGSKADTLNGEIGDDSILANAGNDTIDGGDDTDTVDGGAGTDSCTNGETVTNCELP